MEAPVLLNLIVDWLPQDEVNSSVKRLRRNRHEKCSLYRA
jgi:hypothetical protein